MNTRLQLIVDRRAALVREIALERDRSAARLAELRTQLCARRRRTGPPAG